jgi:hypothetical protein
MGGGGAPEAYEVRLLWECAEPLLPSVEEAYVLTMADSDRLARADGIRRLCARTYVQINRGYRSGLKGAEVDCPSRDIVHAYQHVCRQCTRAGPVLILEDDATLMPDAAARHFAAADRFVAAGAFDVYSLGSFGPFATLGAHPRYACFVGFLQAAVYSAPARAHIARASLARVKHVDAHVVSALPRKHTYRRPLVVQHFAETANMQEWGCSRREHTRCERRWVRAFVAVLRNLLRLDRELWGWHALYAANAAPLVCAWACAAASVAYAVARAAA